MAHPSARSTHIGSVLCFVSGTTRRAFLGGVGRVYLLDLDAKPCRFVGDEQGELVEAPRILHPVVFAGSCPTTGACRVLAYSCKRLYFDRPYALFEGMIDDLARKLVVDIRVSVLLGERGKRERKKADPSLKLVRMKTQPAS